MPRDDCCDGVPALDQALPIDTAPRCGRPSVTRHGRASNTKYRLVCSSVASELRMVLKSLRERARLVDGQARRAGRGDRCLHRPDGDWKRRKPSVAILKRLARAFGVTVTELLE